METTLVLSRLRDGHGAGNAGCLRDEWHWTNQQPRYRQPGARNRVVGLLLQFWRIQCVKHRVWIHGAVADEDASGRKRQGAGHCWHVSGWVPVHHIDTRPVVGIGWE